MAGTNENEGRSMKQAMKLDFRSLKIGDTVQWLHKPKGGRAVLRPGAPSWYVIRVFSGAEIEVEQELLELGAEDAWHQREEKKRRITDGPRKNEIVTWSVAKVPGYTMVCFAGTPRWDVVNSVRKVLGVLGNAGAMQLRAEDVDWLKTLRAKEQQAAVEGLIKSEAAKAAFSVGDRVEVIFGVWAGFSFEITKIAAAGCSGEVDLFGRPTPITMQREYLRNVADATASDQP